MVGTTNFGSGLYFDGYGTDRRVPQGYETVYYDSKTGQFMRPNPEYNGLFRNVPQYIPVKSGNTQPGPATYVPPTVDFNSLPKQVIAQAQPYVRPTAPAQPQGIGYRPQFDPTFIQQMLAQRFGNNQGTGIPTATRPVGPPTLTPGATQTYGGYQGLGGLGALRGIANPVGGQGEAV